MTVFDEKSKVLMNIKSMCESTFGISTFCVLVDDVSLLFCVFFCWTLGLCVCCPSDMCRGLWNAFVCV